MRADELLEEGVRRLRTASHRFGWQGDEDDQASTMLEHTLGHEPDDDEDVSPAKARRFRALVERRMTGEPLAYIVGWCEFRDFRLKVRPGGFIPRATTEFLAEQGIRRLRRRSEPVAVDLATGIGPVALSMAKAVRHAEVHGCDLSARAVAQGRANAKALGLRNISFHTGDLLAPLPKRLRGAVDVITIHPPYVGLGEIRDLPVEIRRFEPKESLTDRSPDGFGLVGRTVTEAQDWLKPGGWLCIEIMPAMARAVRTMLVREGYEDVRSTKGPMRWTRVLVGRMP